MLKRSGCGVPGGCFAGGNWQVEIGRRAGFYCGEAAVTELLCASLVVEYVAGGIWQVESAAVGRCD